MAKRVTVCFLLLFTIMFTGFVYAADPIAEETGAQVSNNIQGFVKGFTSAFYTSEAEGFYKGAYATRILLAVLLFLIIYNIVPSIVGKDSKKVAFFISVAVTLLAMMSIPSGFLDSIATQYGAMGAALLSAIPFVLVLITTVRLSSPLAARVVWLFYALYYFGLYIYKIITNPVGWSSVENIPYLIALIAGVIMFFFIVKIQHIVFKGELETIEQEGKKMAQRRKLLGELEKDNLESFGSGI